MYIYMYLRTVETYGTYSIYTENPKIHLYMHILKTCRKK